MIVPMKKLSVLLYHKEKQDFLKSLQEIGIIHIVENTEVEQPEAASETYQRANNISKTCARMVQILSKIAKEKDLALSQEKPATAVERNVFNILREFEAAEEKKEALQQNLSEIRKDINQLQPWGEFDPEVIGFIQKKGIKLRFFESTEKKFKQLKMDDFFYEIIHRDKSKVRFLVLEKERPFEADGANEVNLPLKSLQNLHQESERLEEERADIDKIFEKLAAHIDTLNECRVDNSNIATFATADLNMVNEIEDKVFSLTGWFPARREKAVNDFLDNYLCYYRIDIPEVNENVPILLKNNRFARLFEPITRIYSLPAYRELDPTPFFAPFFLVYFGLCLGDLGYGAITVFIATIAFFKGPKQYRNLYVIGLLLGGMTIVSGIALNSFFGQSIFYLKGNKEYFFRTESGEMMSFLGSFINAKKMTEFPAMGFAIFLGVVQVLLGIVLQCVNRIRQNGFVWGIHPASFFIIICGILFSIGIGSSNTGFKGITGIDISTYKLGAFQIGSWLTIPPQEFGLFLIVFGLVLMFLFNNPDKSIFIRPLFGLWELYGFATGIIGDILSYLRLFALGLASGLLGHAFNGIAFGFIENNIFPGIFATIALLIFAHTLNFGLAILGSFVHPLRLTFVEFYKNLDFEGGGKNYAPFLKEKV
ncbi:MAG: hypothetical protein HN580_20165 [Deltaproteobacteria bacterium]|nr:hypothetical protein [Deltaproteobacteria bacterium]